VSCWGVQVRRVDDEQLTSSSAARRAEGGPGRDGPAAASGGEAKAPGAAHAKPAVGFGVRPRPLAVVVKTKRKADEPAGPSGSTDAKRQEVGPASNDGQGELRETAGADDEGGGGLLGLGGYGSSSSDGGSQ
jgi:hypothetical protein